MAIDDNTTYGLTGAQIKELPAKIDAVKGLAKVLTTADYNANSNNWNDTDPANFNCVALWKLPPGIYSWPFSFGSSGSKEFLPRVYITNGYLSEYSGLAITGYSSVENSTGVPTDIQILDVSLPSNGVYLYRVNISTGSASSTWAGRNMLTSLNIANSLTSDSPQDVLSARQGKVLNNKIGGDLSNLTTTDKSSLINAINEVAGAGGGGGITELTSADYNYPTANPTGVALWLLEPGNYWAQFGVRVYITSSDSFDAGGWQATVEPEQNSYKRGFFFKEINTSEWGRWKAVPSTGSGSYIQLPAKIVQSTGFSSTDVMSQSATSNMVFADPSTKTRVQIGANATASIMDATAIGQGAKATGQGAIAIGRGTRGDGANAISLGVSGVASNTCSIAVGDSPRAGREAVSIGREAGYDSSSPNSVTPLDSISLGSYSLATRQGEMNIGNRQGLGFNNSNYRLLTGLYDPQSAHDAATKGYVDPTTDSSAPTSSTAGRLGEIRIDTTDNSAYMCVVSDSVTPTYTWKKITA